VALSRFRDAGFDHVYVHQFGRDQERLIALYEEDILPQLTAAPA
jgi:coenzyme F420-dependent glucose-6-phosphate dehydrogenase